MPSEDSHAMAELESSLAAQTSELVQNESILSNHSNSEALHSMNDALALDLSKIQNDTSSDSIAQAPPSAPTGTLPSPVSPLETVDTTLRKSKTAKRTPKASSTPTFVNKTTWGHEATRMMVQHYGKHFKMTQLVWAESLLKQKLAGHRLTNATVTVRKSNISWDLVAMAIYQQTNELHSAYQCRQKWKTMYRSYRDAVDNKRSVEKTQFFNEIDGFMNLDKLIQKYPSMYIIKEVVTESTFLENSQSYGDNDHDIVTVPSVSTAGHSTTSSLASSTTELPTVASATNEDARVPSHDSIEASPSAKRQKKNAQNVARNNSFRVETTPTFVITSPPSLPMKEKHGPTDSVELHASVEDSFDTQGPNSMTEKDMEELPFSTMAPIKMTNFVFKSWPHAATLPHGPSTSTKRNSISDRRSLSKESDLRAATQTPTTLNNSSPSYPLTHSHPYSVARPFVYHPSMSLDASCKGAMRPLSTLPPPPPPPPLPPLSLPLPASPLNAPLPPSHTMLHGMKPILPHVSHSSCTAPPMTTSATMASSPPLITFPPSAMMDPVQSLLYYYHSQTLSRLDSLQSSLRHQSELIQRILSTQHHCNQKQNECENASMVLSNNNRGK